MSKKEKNYQDFSKYKVTNHMNKPDAPHFAAVCFGTKQELVSNYYDENTTVTAPDLTYFAFPDKEMLQEWISEATDKGISFFFFEVKAMGVLKVQV